jgi:hypothetical protein
MRQLVPAVVVLLAFAGVHAQQVNPSAFGGLRWRSIGPPRSGYVSAPAGIPGDPTTYYIGLPEGGVWKTTNGGTTWKPIFDEVHVASIGAVAVAPSDPDVVYVGTGNQSGWSFTIGKGVYKSTDAGGTWANVGLRRSQYIGAIAVDPRDPGVVLVAALGSRPAAQRGEGSAPPEDAERGVYRSSDAGRSWTRVLPAEDSGGASEVYLDVDDPRIAYALMTSAAGSLASSAGVYKSTDRGVTWHAVAGRGLPEGARVLSLARSESRPLPLG